MMAAFSGVVPRFVPAPLGVPDPQHVRPRRAPQHSPVAHWPDQPGKHPQQGGRHGHSAGRAVGDSGGGRAGRPAAAPRRRTDLQCGGGAGRAQSARSRRVPLTRVAVPQQRAGRSGGQRPGGQAEQIWCGRTATARCWAAGCGRPGCWRPRRLIALREGPARLKDDHARARQLAEALVEAGYDVNLAAVQTNIIYATAARRRRPKSQRWAEQGVLASALDVGQRALRAALPDRRRDAGAGDWGADRLSG